MEKFMALSMAAIMAFTVVGCGSNRPAETTAAGTAAAKMAAESGTTAADAATEGKTSGAAPGKKYIANISATFVPFEFENEKGEMIGVDLDILQAIAQDQRSGYKVVPVGFSAAATALEADECDGVIVGISVTGERVQKYNFSEPYYDSGVGIAVLADSGITPYDQLRGQRVAARIDAEGYTFAESVAEQYGFEVTQYESSSDMYQAVLTGRAVTCFEDYPVIGYEISKGLGLILPTPKGRGSSHGFATLKGANPKFVGIFNKGLESIKVSGRYDEILNTYIAK